jgi:hypothetical protein
MDLVSDIPIAIPAGAFPLSFLKTLSAAETLVFSTEAG